MNISYLIALVIVFLVVVGVIRYFIDAYNRLVMLRNNVDKSFANIDVLLKQRADEIPNIIKVVKESSKYEQGTLDSLVSLRTQFLNAGNREEKVGLSNEIDKSLKSIFAVSEQYPELRANNNFMLLQQRVSELETHISDRRELFNESVNMYNIGIKEFPPVILAKIAGYQKMNMLVIGTEEKEYHGVQF